MSSRAARTGMERGTGCHVPLDPVLSSAACISRGPVGYAERHVTGCASLWWPLDGTEEVTVTRIEEIQSAIVSLSPEEYALLRHWFDARNWESWDREIEADAASGKLDFLIQEATHEKNRGRLREL